MFTFLSYRLLLAHFIADFPLQTTKLAAIKEKQFTGVLIHSAIYTFILALFGLPVLGKAWPFILIIGITHILIEQGKVSLKRYLRKDNLVMFLSVQALHVGAIFLVTWLANIPTPERPGLPRTITMSLESFLALLSYTYYDDKTTIYYIGYCIAIFSTALLIYYVEQIIMPREEQLKLGDYRELYGYFERAVITTFALRGWYIYILIYAVIRLVINFLIKTFINKDISWRLLIWDTILNITLSTIYGLLIDKWINLM